MIKKFTLQVVLRIFLILINCLFITHFFIKAFWFTLSLFLILLIIQVIQLIVYVNQTNYSLSRFLNALKTQDYSVYFSVRGKGKSFARVYEEFNQIIAVFKLNKIEKEAQLKSFNHIIENINLGIISIKKEDLENTDSTNEIIFLNKAACQILDVPKLKYWSRLSKQAPWFTKAIHEIKDGGKILLEKEVDFTIKQLAVEVQNVSYVNTPYLIVSIQDIKSEIEQKEIEAWYHVIKVEAHDTMNSVTPVSSLAFKIKKMLEDKDGELKACEDLNEETLQDMHLAASTIKKRSDGLLEFVNAYRTISSIPVPDLKPLNVFEFYEHISTLMRHQLEENKIELQIINVPKRAIIQADQKLIEQVFINLIGNSIFALQNTSKPCIELRCDVFENKIELSVKDNGHGIKKSIQNKIFIPFYTTRKNGSGIGLSLSKNIMKQHKGKLSVDSVENEYTKFMLNFPNRV